MGWLESESGDGMTPKQRDAFGELRQHLRGELPWGPAPAGEGAELEKEDAGAGMQGLVRVLATPAREEPDGPRRSGIISYYAAGIGVMFLLFSMTGAAGSILEEEESGTLERLLTSNVRITSILLGKWAFFGAMGLLQLVLMFLWGWAVFGLELFTPSRIAGFVAMSIVTAAAASAFGIALAALCRTRAQLNGISTVVILVMSAIGGSMVPRFVMPKFMDSLALFTFNGWALDGYLKVFWYDQPGVGPAATVVTLWPQLLVLGALAALFLALARRLARRWEVV
jgi:ABC-2 type transport system permease protein